MLLLSFSLSPVFCLHHPQQLHVRGGWHDLSMMHYRQHPWGKAREEEEEKLRGITSGNLSPCSSLQKFEPAS